eukprot:6358921-Amphidinium_carterae.1
MIRAGLELLSFAPRRQETIEAVLLRFDRLLTRADQMANLQISWSRSRSSNIKHIPLGWTTEADLKDNAT